MPILFFVLTINYSLFLGFYNSREINIFLTIITPNTLFIGKKYIYLEKCASTNSYMLDELQSKNIAEGALVFTNEQFNGMRAGW